MMTDRQIRHFERELLALAAPRLDVLEWGCGGSTYYYTQLLEHHGIAYTWTSIEHQAQWHAKIAGIFADNPNVNVHLLTEWDAYVAFPASLGRRFDLILVDGRHRTRCLQQARELLKPGGTVLLHDAQRGRYRGGFTGYPDVRFLCYGLKRGTLRPVSPIRRLTNGLNQLFYSGIKPFYKLRDSIRKRLPAQPS